MGAKEGSSYEKELGQPHITLTFLDIKFEIALKFVPEEPEVFVEEDCEPCCCFLDLCLCLLQWWCFRCFFLCFLATLPDDFSFSDEDDDFFAAGDGIEEVVELGETRQLSFLGVYVWWS